MARYTRLFILCFATLFTLIPLQAMAQDEEEADFGRQGAYAIGRAKWAIVDSDDPLGPNATLDWQSNFGIDLTIGWRETEVLAIEGEFEWIPSVDGISSGTWLLGANTKFYAMTDRIQPYLVLGFNGMWAKVDGNDRYEVDWGFRQGIGLDYYLTKDLAITGEGTWTWGVGDLLHHRFATIGVGVLYRFGGDD
jgi:opacity protein-like surface antigen